MEWLKWKTCLRVVAKLLGVSHAAFTENLIVVGRR